MHVVLDAHLLRGYRRNNYIRRWNPVNLRLELGQLALQIIDVALLLFRQRFEICDSLWRCLLSDRRQSHDRSTRRYREKAADESAVFRFLREAQAPPLRERSGAEGRN